jgi:phage recombination protein Bet
MEKGVTLKEAVIDYSNQKMLDTIRQTVAVGATDAEFAMFIELCRSTGLNPFRREIWFIKTKEKNFTGRDGQPVHVPAKVQMMVGINGFFQIANAHPQFDGMEEPIFEENPDGTPKSCTVKVWRKDRRFPSVGVARFAEYFPGKSRSGRENWDVRPFHMLAKVAKSIALREAFPQELNGLYTEDECHEQNEPESAPHPLDAVPVKVAVQAANVRSGETAKQAATRELMGTGETWVYDSAQIVVDETERKAFWAKLVRDYGAVRDTDGVIHTSVPAMEIADALISKPALEEASPEVAA